MIVMFLEWSSLADSFNLPLQSSKSVNDKSNNWSLLNESDNNQYDNSTYGTQSPSIMSKPDYNKYKKPTTYHNEPRDYTGKYINNETQPLSEIVVDRSIDKLKEKKQCNNVLDSLDIINQLNSNNNSSNNNSSNNNNSNNNYHGKTSNKISYSDIKNQNTIHRNQNMNIKKYKKSVIVNKPSVVNNKEINIYKQKKNEEKWTIIVMTFIGTLLLLSCSKY